MSFNREKFKSLVQYICWRTDDPSKLGAVKLNKILWLCDFTAFYRFSTSLTGARYVKQKFGPVPGAIIPIVRELEASGDLTITEEVHAAYTQKAFTAHRHPVMDAFSGDEIALVDDIIKYVCDEHTAKTISELSHDHIWRIAQTGEELPYFTIFARPTQPDENEIEWARIAISGLAS